MSTGAPISICFISRFAASLFFPEEAVLHGGAETQFYLNARELAGRPGATVHCIVQGAWKRESAVVDKVHVHFMPFGPGISAKWRFQKLLARIGADVYLQQGTGSTTKEVAFFRVTRGRRFVYWIASDSDVDPALPHPGLDRPRSFVWGMLRADRIIAQTSAQADALLHQYGRVAEIIANGFAARTPPSRAGRERILWVGRFAPVKRPELFIQLARQLPGERFLMISPVEGELCRAHYETHRAAIGATANLEFIPGEPLQKIDERFDRAELLVNTSVTEGFPNTFVQAMWSATPIASLAFDPDGVIAREGLGVPPPRSDADRTPEGFAKLIAAFLADPVAQKRAGEAALARARKHHDLSRNMDRLLESLRDLSGR